jgi:hypothetical protein
MQLNSQGIPFPQMRIVLAFSKLCYNNTKFPNTVIKIVIVAMVLEGRVR